MLVKYYKKFNTIQQILLGTGILVSLFFFIILLYQKKIPDGNVIFLVDVSHSMNVKVENNLSRLDLSKKVIENIIQKDKNQHQFGVIIFNKNATYYVAPTFDTGTLINFVQSLQTNILPGGNTNLQSAINIFEASKTEGDIAVIITDGDDIEISSGFDIGENIITIGIGNNEKGKVLYPDGTIVSDKNGKIIYSKLDKSFIKKTSKKHFFVQDIDDTRKIDLGNNIFVNDSLALKIYIFIMILILFGLKL